MSVNSAPHCSLISLFSVSHTEESEGMCVRFDNYHILDNVSSVFSHHVWALMSHGALYYQHSLDTLRHVHG